MNILETITLRTKERIAEEKQHLPLSEVRRQAEEKQKQADVPDFEAALRAPGLSFICESLIIASLIIIHTSCWFSYILSSAVCKRFYSVTTVPLSVSFFRPLCPFLLPAGSGSYGSLPASLQIPDGTVRPRWDILCVPEPSLPRCLSLP